MFRYVVLGKYAMTFLFWGCWTAYAQTPQPAKSTEKETLQLKESRFDFGKILQGRPVTHLFEVTNAGQETLKLENVQASCGCTTPEWSLEPVAPGGTTSIRVGYNAAAEGPFEKTVTIYYNGSQTKVMVISGSVFKAPATAAPLNTSVQLLKQIHHTN